MYIIGLLFNVYCNFYCSPAKKNGSDPHFWGGWRRHWQIHVPQTWVKQGKMGEIDTEMKNFIICTSNLIGYLGPYKWAKSTPSLYTRFVVEIRQEMIDVYLGSYVVVFPGRYSTMNSDWLILFTHFFAMRPFCLLYEIIGWCMYNYDVIFVQAHCVV